MLPQHRLCVSKHHNGNAFFLLSLFHPFFTSHSRPRISEFFSSQLARHSLLSSIVNRCLNVKGRKGEIERKFVCLRYGDMQLWFGKSTYIEIQYFCCDFSIEKLSQVRFRVVIETSTPFVHVERYLQRYVIR